MAHLRDALLALVYENHTSKQTARAACACRQWRAASFLSTSIISVGEDFDLDSLTSEPEVSDACMQLRETGFGVMAPNVCCKAHVLPLACLQSQPKCVRCAVADLPGLEFPGIYTSHARAPFLFSLWRTLSAASPWSMLQPDGPLPL